MSNGDNKISDTIFIFFDKPISFNSIYTQRIHNTHMISFEPNAIDLFSRGCVIYCSVRMSKIFSFEIRNWKMRECKIFYSFHSLPVTFCYLPNPTIIRKMFCFF